MRPDWVNQRAERSYVLPVFAGIAFLVIAVAAGFYLTQPKTAYVIPDDVVARFGSPTRTIAMRLNNEPCNKTLVKTLTDDLINSSEYAAAVSFIKYTEKKCGPNENLLMSLYIAQKNSSDLAAAEATATRALGVFPVSADVYFSRAEVRREAGNFEGAYSDYRKTAYILSDPSEINETVFRNFADVADKLGRPCEASAIFQDFIAFDTENRRTPAAMALVRDWQKKGHCPKAFGYGHAKLYFDKSRQIILLPVMVNGVEAHMIVDTGASRTVLTKSFARRADIEPSTEKGAVVHTANGAIWQMGGRAEHIALGGASADNVPIFIQTDGQSGFGGHVDGLLGLSFLGNFKFTVSNGVLELRPLS
jgi:clan AA aspartic protease (TIGR02281 family)